jgi:hypothetical protein
MSHSQNILKIIFLILFCLCNAACQSGIVSLENRKTGTMPFIKVPPAGGSSEDKPDTAPESMTIGDSIVYFISIVTDTNLLPIANGLGFLSSNSTITNPFRSYLSPRPFNQLSWRPVVVGETKRVSWIERPRSFNTPHLKVLDPGTLTVQDFGEIFDALNWSVSNDVEWVAGVQEDGKALLKHMTSGTTLPFLEKELSKDSKTMMLQSCKRVAILDPVAARVDLFSVLEPHKVIQSWSSKIFSASPSGKHILVANGDQLEIIETNTGQTTAIPKDIFNLRLPQWKDDSILVFVSGTANNSQIQLLDINTGRVQPITFLTALEEEENLICPAWINNDLFYADHTGNKNWSIFKVEDPASKFPIPKIFVQPIESEKGYVCPKGILG